MTGAIIDYALRFARLGLRVFPAMPNSKVPALKNPYDLASNDERQIISWWQENNRFNLGLCGGYQVLPGKFLGFIDVDCKHEGKSGFDTMLKLELDGFPLPETLAQSTPTGGRHFFYLFDFPIQNSVGKLGPGIDTRGFRGYVIGAGSVIGDKRYRFFNSCPIVEAPAWLSERLKKSDTPNPSLTPAQIVCINQAVAERQAIAFLKRLPVAKIGERNKRCFDAFARLREFGVSRERSIVLIDKYWRRE